MWQLYQFPLCPFSRKIQACLMSEKNVAYDLGAREDPWSASDDIPQSQRCWPYSCATETRAKALRSQIAAPLRNILKRRWIRSPMINGTAAGRAEIRRLTALFDENFYADVTAPLLNERMKKRIVTKQPPDSRVLREAMRLSHGHLDYIDWLIDNRPWLAGSTMSMADLAAAAQISVADYLGGIDWKGHEQTRGWYAVFKSRPSFRPLLSERMDVIKPPDHYSKVDG